MSHWKVGRALHSPKGILSHSYRPILPRVKAVYCLDSSSIGTYQNPEFISNVEKWAAPARLSSVSQMQGNGWESLTVKELGFLKSIQKRSDLSFFLTSTTALAHFLKKVISYKNVTLFFCLIFGAVFFFFTYNISSYYTQF